MKNIYKQMHHEHAMAPIKLAANIFIPSCKKFIDNILQSVSPDLDRIQASKQ